MKINFSLSSNYANAIKSNNQFNRYSSNALERTPNCDVVSFSGKNSKKFIEPRVQTATNYGKSILNTAKLKPLTIQDISNITAQYSDNVTVYPMSELKKKNPNAENYAAFVIANMNSDFKADTKEMYVEMIKPNADKMEQLLFAMNCSHEYTHIEQADGRESFEALKEMTNGDYEFAKAIICIGDAVFSVFDTKIQAETLAPLMQKNINPYEFMKYRVITPKEAYVTKQMLPEGMGVKSERDMKKLLRNTYDLVYLNMIQLIEENRPEILSMIPPTEDIDSLKEKVRKYCVQKAISEKEAYTTESQIAKKTMGTNKCLNIDAFPMFYETLEQAFS